MTGKCQFVWLLMISPVYVCSAMLLDGLSFLDEGSLCTPSYTHTTAYLPLSDYEELVLNVLSTLNNLSYYAQPESCLIQRQQELAECKLIKKPQVIWRAFPPLNFYSTLWAHHNKSCSSHFECAETLSPQKPNYTKLEVRGGQLQCMLRKADSYA